MTPKLWEILSIRKQTNSMFVLFKCYSSSSSECKGMHDKG